MRSRLPDATVRGRIAGPPTSRNSKCFPSVAEPPTSDHHRGAARAPRYGPCIAIPFRHEGQSVGSREFHRGNRDRYLVRESGWVAPASGLRGNGPESIRRSLPTPCRFAMLREGSGSGVFDACVGNSPHSGRAKRLARGKSNGGIGYRNWGIPGAWSRCYGEISITLTPVGASKRNSESAGAVLKRCSRNSTTT